MSALATMQNQLDDRADAAGLGLDDLKLLLRSVTDTTERLHETHSALQSQVAHLQRELAETRAKLRRSEALAALGEMAAGIAHEIRNPLASIQLYTQMLAEDIDADAIDAGSGQLCEKIERAVVRLDAIVRDVLLFARETRLSPQQIAAHELAQQALQTCESLVRQREAQVSCSGGEHMQLCIDVSLMTIAIANVLRNGIEAAVAHGVQPRIEMSWDGRRLLGSDRRRSEHAVLTIRDNGPGVPEDVLERMFNPFFTTRETGTGLGLAIVHRIIDAHGGQISVHNADELQDAPPRAVFELIIPLHDYRATRSVADTATSPHTKQSDQAHVHVCRSSNQLSPHNQPPSTEVYYREPNTRC